MICASIIRRLLFYITHIALVGLSFLISSSAAYGVGMFLAGEDFQRIVGDSPDRAHPVFWLTLVIALGFVPVLYLGLVYAVIIPMQVWILPGFPVLFSPGVSRFDQRQSLMPGLKKYALAVIKYEECYQREHIEMTDIASE